MLLKTWAGHEAETVEGSRTAVKSTRLPRRLMGSPPELSANPVELTIASPSFYPDFGGAELRFRRYLPGLSKRGVSTSVVTGTPKAQKLTRADRQAEWYRIESGAPVPSKPLDGCPVYRVRLPDRGGRRRADLLFGTLLRHCQAPETRPDVVQVVGSLPQSLHWLAELRGLGVRLVFGAVIAFKRRHLRDWLGLRRYRGALEIFDCIVALNAPLREELRALGVRNRIDLIPNGVDLERFHPLRGPDERELRARLGLAEDAALLLSVGSVHPRKGTHILLEAFARLAPHYPDLHLAVAGPRRDLERAELAVFRARLARLVERSGAADRIHLPGEIADVDVWLRAADVFALPTEREGMPNAVLEAMASGLPVVLTPFVGRSAELGRPGEHYELVERKPEALAATLGRLLDDSAARLALGGAARSWVETTMDLDLTLNRYAALYRELAQ